MKQSPIKHKWTQEDTCLVCGLKRKKVALTPMLLTFGAGRYLYSYWVDNEWKPKRPNCIKQTENNN